ncbi:hypothetical protein ABZ313_29780 [Streptomyces sp. NPDC006251]|uniref:hypothetical protein n=1 Tax=Streptomyces sp. NPDC006251 TaxID=3155718 RepID=UPI0033BD23B0
MRTRTALTTALLALAALTGCSSDNSGSKAETPATSAVTSSPPATYTAEDCRTLLEENYTAGTPQDVSEEPECADLTSDEYADAVGQVLTGHKDDILNDAANEVVWDTAWDELDADAQTNICDLLLTEGPEAATTEGLTKDQLQYFLDNKC